MYRAILYRILLGIYVLLYLWLFYKSSLLGGLQDVFVIMPDFYLYLLLAVIGLISFVVFKIRPRKEGLSFFEIVALFTIYSAVLLTSPLFSQDVYWNLAHSSNFLSGINPYTNSISGGLPSIFSMRVYEWQNITMTYGPMSVYIYSIPLLFTGNSRLAILILRVIWLGVLVLCARFISKIANVSNSKSLHEKSQIQLMIFFSPLILIFGLADLHNDVFVLLALLSFYYFLQQKKYGYALLSIVLGLLTKYILVMFFPLLVFDWLSANKSNFVSSMKSFLLGFILLFLTLVVAYLPFVTSTNVMTSLFSGLYHQVYFAPGIPHLSLGVLHLLSEVLRFNKPVLASILLGSLWACWFLKSDRPYEAILFPLVLVISSSSWIMPWYYLWILPFLILRYRGWGNILFLSMVCVVRFELFANFLLLISLLARYLLKINSSTPLSPKPTIPQ